MGKLIDVNFRDGPHLSGNCVCLHCKATWVGVAPVGTVDLECPKCGTMQGVFNSVVCPDDVWQCGCGCHHFFVTPEYCMCCHCGVTQEFD